MKQCLGVAILTVAAALSWPVQAHHSFAVYDRSKLLTLKGSVKTFQWTNPHCVIWVLVQPDSGGEPQEWSFETTSPGVLTRGGWTRNSVKPGDKVSVEFYPLRDGSHGGGLSAVTLVDTGQKLSTNFAASEKPELK
ncbi:MAG TPA: DUF6152 family protein [Steroidobacteraceae bacterium]|jgi:hypothetical protein|nr:DUF6152 family protein [Steroidobacteraceae bacterium]